MWNSDYIGPYVSPTQSDYGLCVGNFDRQFLTSGGSSEQKVDENISSAFGSLGDTALELGMAFLPGAFLLSHVGFHRTWTGSFI